jgi:DNA-binding transcriptional ArsR family regulator
MPDADWISLADFAAAAGIEERSASKACARAADGKLWKGHRLAVRHVPGRGGKGGLKWEILAASLPDICRARLPVPAMTKAPAGPLTDWQRDTVAFRRHLVQQVLTEAPAKGTPARAAAVARIAAQTHLFRGKAKRVHQRTLYAWVRAAEEGGSAALIPQRPSHAGQPRVTISRAYDKGIDLDEATVSELAQTIEEMGRRLTVRTHYSARKIAFRCSRLLERLSRAAGSKLSDAELRQLCRLEGRWAERFRDDLIVRDFNLDASRYHAKHTPRTSRTPPARPMVIVFGDVWNADMVFLTDQGEAVREKVIAWQDACTRYVWATPLLIHEGAGHVCQEDVADAFYHLLVDAGMPRVLDLDNGGEYAALGRAFDEVWPDIGAMLKERGRTVHAKPYNGPAKGGIERFFGKLKDNCGGSRGFIGGDRMRKKTQTHGKPPEPFVETAAEIVRRIHTILEITNREPMPALGGISPREAFEAHIQIGWQPVRCDRDAFDALICKCETRSLRQGVIQINGQRFYHDELAATVADKVDVRIPLRSDANRVGVWDDGQFLCWAVPDTPFDMLDPEGAKEAGRRQRLHLDAVRGINAECPEIDGVAEMADAVGLSPAASVAHRAIVKGGAAADAAALADARQGQSDADRAADLADLRAYLERDDASEGGA